MKIYFKSLAILTLVTANLLAAPEGKTTNPESPKKTGSKLDLLSAVRGGHQRKIVIMGTSLSTAKYGNWPSLMETWLKSEASDPKKVSIVNLAISGSNSKGGGINQLKKIKAQNPDTVFMEFSMNDAYKPYKISPQQSKDNHNSIINALKEHNPDVEIIIQIMNNPLRGHLKIRPKIADYYQTARNVATEQKLLVIDHYPNWLALHNTNPTQWAKYVPDGIHPVKTGYENILIPQLKQSIKAHSSAP